MAGRSDAAAGEVDELRSARRATRANRMFRSRSGFIMRQPVGKGRSLRQLLPVPNKKIGPSTAVDAVDGSSTRHMSAKEVGIELINQTCRIFCVEWERANDSATAERARTGPSTPSQNTESALNHCTSAGSASVSHA